MPKLEWPAYFEDGLLGVKVTQDVQVREAYLAVPVKMHISVSSARRHEVLGPILEQHSESFPAEYRDQLTLCLFLLHEITKGKQSYWYPYLRILPEIYSVSSWQEHEIELLQEDHFKYYVEEHKLKQYRTFGYLEKVMN